MSRIKKSAILLVSFIFIFSVIAAQDGISQTKREHFELDGSLHKNYKLEKNGRFSLENHNGEIEIVSWDKDEVDIEITERYGIDEEKIEIEIIASKDRVTVRAIHPDYNRRWWRDSRRKPVAEFRVKVPKEVQLEVASHNGKVSVDEIQGSVDVNTHNGGVQLSNMTGDVYAESHNGGIEIERSVGDMQVEVHNGDIEINDASGELSASSHNGSIWLRNLKSPRIEVETHNGKITGDFEPDDKGDYEFSTENGRIDIRIPENSKIDVEVRCRSRNFDTDFDVFSDDSRDRYRRYDRDERMRARGSINGGGARMYLRANNGNIRLRSR